MAHPGFILFRLSVWLLEVEGYSGQGNSVCKAMIAEEAQQQRETAGRPV